MLSLLSSNQALVLKVAGIIICVNVVLSGLSKILDGLAAQEPNSAGIKQADTIVQKIAGILQKVVDFISANVPH